MKKLIIFALLTVLLVGCADSGVNDGVGLVSGDSAIEGGITENKQGSFELICDTSDISGLRQLNETVYFDDGDNYYMFDGDSMELLEKRMHSISDGERVFETSLYYLSDELVYVSNGWVISGNEFIFEFHDVGSMSQLYLASSDSEAMTPLLSDTAFGFSFDEYYALSDKWSTIYWCESFKISPSKDKIAYWSNKGTDGVDPIFESGIWIYDLETKEEYRLDIDMQGDISVSCIEWVNDNKVLFSYDKDGIPVYCVYDLNDRLFPSEFSSPAENTALGCNVMIYSLSECVEIIEFDSAKIHYFEIGKLISFYSPEVVSTEKTIAFADRDNDVYVFDLRTDSYEVYPSEFGELKVSVADVSENGDVLVNILSDDLMQIEGIYRIKR